MASSFDLILSRARGGIREIIPQEVREKIETDGRFVLLDIREKEEVDQGHLPGAVHLPRGYLELRVERMVPDKGTTLIIYCAGGVRSALAAETLQAMGYTDVVSMRGGFGQWKQAGFPFVIPQGLEPDRLARYSRNIKVSEVGVEGQMKLLRSRVLLVGAGGLGSPAAIYLAAAGVGTLGIVDSDVVDETNLQRQILHRSHQVGMPKTASAKQTLFEVNPEVKVVPYQMRLGPENVMGVVQDYDVVIDGGDNFPTKYLVSDACVLAGKPNVYGSIFQFEGQVSTFIPGLGPCYRCLFPEPAPADLAPT